MKIDPKKILEDLTAADSAKVKEYQKLHMRLKVLKSQMSDIQDETHDLIDTLEKMRAKENKDKNNG